MEFVDSSIVEQIEMKMIRLSSLYGTNFREMTVILKR
jgi:hypothetical protein